MDEAFIDTWTPGGAEAIISLVLAWKFVAILLTSSTVILVALELGLIKIRVSLKPNEIELSRLIL